MAAITATVVLAISSFVNPAYGYWATTGSVAGPYYSTTTPVWTYTGDLRNLPITPPSMAKYWSRRHTISATVNQPSAQPDPLVRDMPEAANAMPAPIQSFAGMSNGAEPPDTNGDVGPNHYVQAMNTSFAVYGKTGTLLAGPTSFNDLFLADPSTGSPCDNGFVSDPIVLYDVIADRWVISILAITGFTPNRVPFGPFYQCMAVSRTPDPITGGWNKYAFIADETRLNDYPKLAVWRDGYYMSANLFGSITFDHVRVWAFDRSAMLAGKNMREVHFDVSRGYTSLLPANIRGTAAPIGSPEFFMSSDAYTSSKLHLWRFHVDFGTPYNSWFGTDSSNSNPINLTVAGYAIPTYNATQPNTSVSLDALSDRLMYGLQYRPYANGTESLWANHTVNNAGRLALRWYEITNLNGTVSVNQQGTYSPDPAHRWMGSLAVDHAGNMAIGYSTSSSSIFPGIGYAGRLAADAAGTLGQGGYSYWSGTGNHIACSGANCISRWGDYSAMTIDPSDDCTFWYTNEYGNGTSGYGTRVVAFRFPSCNTSLVVDRTDDVDDHRCTTNFSDCTLRGAISLVNGGGYAGAITFAVPIIKLTGPLPALTASHIAIQGSLGVPLIDLAASASDGLVIAGSEDRISGLSIVNGTDPYSDIHITSGTRNIIDGNYLGTVPPAPAVANCTPSIAGGPITRQSGYGISISAGVTGTSDTRAASAYIFNNTIGCHASDGVRLSGASFVRIGESENGANSGNYIGVNAGGVSLPNGGNGITIHQAGNAAASANIITGNIIATNGFYGVLFDGPGTTDNWITYTSLLQNGYDGIAERNDAANNRWSRISTGGNGGLGIDRNAFSDASNEITPPYPTISSVVKTVETTTISGSGFPRISGVLRNNSTDVEVYSMAIDPTGIAEGITYLGHATTDENGLWNLTLPSSQTSDCVVAFETNVGQDATFAYRYSTEFSPGNCRVYLPVTVNGPVLSTKVYR